MSNAFGGKGSKKVDYPEEPITMHEEKHEMTKEELDALSPEERERIIIQAWENAMSETIDGFNKANRGKDNGRFTDD